VWRRQPPRDGSSHRAVDRNGLRLVWTSPTAFNRVEFEGRTEQARGLSLHLSNCSIAFDQALGADERMRLAARLWTAFRDALAAAALSEGAND
jgi:uncharacterized membrane protein